MIRCLGEALVDLICERPAASLAEADAFRPHFGGALANVAVAAARAGADAGLAGAAGDDEWGRWLRERLEAEGVDLEFFDLAEGAQTPVAFATVDEHGEPSFLIYGEAIADALEQLGPRLEELVDGADALVFNSTTLAEAGERRVTDAARERALAGAARVCFDPNVRPNRWRGGYEEAVRESRAADRGQLPGPGQPRGGDGDHRHRRPPPRGRGAGGDGGRAGRGHARRRGGGHARRLRGRGTGT